jgi:hypothetical protein
MSVFLLPLVRAFAIQGSCSLAAGQFRQMVSRLAADAQARLIPPSARPIGATLWHRS